MEIAYFETQLNFVGLSLPLRSTLIKNGNALILISPINFTEEQVSQIRKVGEVTDIVAPNLLHHLYAQKTKDIFPNATLWKVPGLEKKRPAFSWNKTLSQDTWPHADFLDLHLLKGAPKMSEVVFLHKPTRSLIVTDLFFNLQNPNGFLAPVLLRILGTYKKFAASMLLKKYVSNREEFKNSLQHISKWDFDRIIVAHGDILAANGKTMFTESLTKKGWL